MIVSTIHSCRLYHLALLSLWLVLMTAGCAHMEKQAPGVDEVKQRVETATTMEKRGDMVGAIEDLEIALTIDPKNKKLHEELNRLVAKRNNEADQHYRAGIAARDSSAQEARKKFLDALRLNPDYTEAITALRDLQLATVEAILQARLKKEAAHTAAQAKSKAHEDDEELDTETYSLDIAVAAFEDGDYTAAIRQFSKMKARYPNDPDIQAYLDRSWYNIAIDQFNKKNYKKALDSFSRVPKQFDNVDDYMAKCRQALKTDSGTKKKTKR